MKTASWKYATAIVATIAMQLSPLAMAATTAPTPIDIALGNGGVLIGQVFDTQGVALGMAQVTIYAQGKELIRTETDTTGNFRVEGLKGGVYQIAAGEQFGVYRLWASETAPPSAKQGLMMVAGGDVIRSQYGGGGPVSPVIDFIARHPILTGAAIVTAVAIPLALDDDDGPSSP